VKKFTRISPSGKAAAKRMVMINLGDSLERAAGRTGCTKPPKNRLIRAEVMLLFERAGKRNAPLEAGGICPRGLKNDSCYAEKI
jgi:hypothetical protein